LKPPWQVAAIYATCFMNDCETPQLVFEQHGDDRNVIHDDHYQLLLKDATR
jgi:hypothetical protein